MKYALLSSIGLALFTLSCANLHLTSNDREPASSSAPQFIPGNEYQTKLLALLASAKTSIDIVQFNFASSSGIAEKLIAIKNQHQNDPQFRIHVMVEKEGFGSAKTNFITLETLKAAGFAANPTKDTAYAYFQIEGKTNQSGLKGINHTKLLMVDGHKILAGSTNWTLTSITKNNETNLFIDSVKFGNQLGTYISALKQKSSELIPSVTQENITTLFTDNAYFDELTSFLSSVRSGDQLNCSMYLFNVGDTTAPKNLNRAEKIAGLLSQAQKNGATVHLLLENSNQAFGEFIVKANKKAELLLKQNGLINVSWDNPSQITHMKFCVISRVSGQFDIIMGSTNWNYLDIDLNHQLNWLITGDRGSFAKPLLQYFNAAVKF